MDLLKVTQHQIKKLPHLKKMVVACSGGVDSVVLAHILRGLYCDLVIAHFNHGWREVESDRDEVLVKDLAKQWNIPIEIERGEKSNKGNAENEARKARYAFLEEVRQKHNADCIAVAHHQDDQIETILMHQKRGAGLRGLAGMAFQRGFILRPLLEVPKKEINDYAKAHQLKWREDATNKDLNFTRNHLRHVEIPKLKAQDSNFEEKLLKKSADARQKLEKLQREVQQWFEINLKENQLDRNAFGELNDDCQSEVVIQLLGAVDLYQKTINRFKNWANYGRSGTKLVVKGQTFWCEREQIFIQPPRRRDYIISPSRVRITKKGIQWGSYHLKNLTHQKLFVRQWQAGDRFQPSGMKGSKKVQDFFVDQKIPLHQRSQIPIILNEEGVIVAIGNLRVAQGAEDLKKDLEILKKS